MKLLFLTKMLFLTLILLFTGSNFTQAKCVSYGEISVLDYNSHDMIFSGEILEIERGFLNIFHFRVNRALKNCEIGDTVEIVSYTPGGMNGFYGEIGDKWLMFSNFVPKPNEVVGYYNYPNISGFVSSHCHRNSKIGTEQYKKDLLNLEQTLRKLDGYHFYYYPDSSLCAEGRFIDSLAEGKWIYYCENGQLRMMGEYYDGLEEGVWLQNYNSIFFFALRFYS